MRPEEQSRLEENAWRLGIDIKRAKSIGKWTGFRPARPSIRVEIDKNIGVREGVKFLHNYGHGGSGWTVCTGVAKEVSKLLARS